MNTARIPALKRQGQKDQEFEANLGYTNKTLFFKNKITRKIQRKLRLRSSKV
jgi:hypothetical protein